jgi:DNA/RNA endonuclease YhcR with UshA esterase domain
MAGRLALAIVGVALWLAVAAVPVAAHHSFAAEFDAGRPVTLHGTVSRMDWVNPHSWIHLDVKNDDGTITTWMIEGGTPNTLLRRGFTKDSLKAGTELTVEGYRAKNGANRANGRDLVLPGGQRLFLGSSGTGAPSDGRDSTEK